MRFLIDANMPRSTSARLVSLGHEAVDVRDVGPRDATDLEVAAYARTHQLAIITQDGDFGDVRNYPPADYFGIVVLALPSRMTSEQILCVLMDFVSRTEFVMQLPGKLAVVEIGRVRFRAH